MTSTTETLKNYSKELLKTYLHYANEHEVKQIAHLLEQQIQTSTKQRYHQGLHAAAYDLYSRFFLEGGAK